MRMKPAELLEKITEMDRSLWADGTQFAGIDEAGRGPLAGPVVAGCVVMPPDPLLEGINDSKKVAEKRRELLHDRILETAVFAQVGIVTVEEIDQLNILNATKLAMARAAEGAPCTLFLVDGSEEAILPGTQRAIVHGDALCYSIAAASILAKVTRDRMMRQLDETYPQYGFAVHKGYGTKAHIDALRTHGPCPAHRPLFIRKYV